MFVCFTFSLKKHAAAKELKNDPCISANIVQTRTKKDIQLLRNSYMYFVLHILLHLAPTDFLYLKATHSQDFHSPFFTFFCIFSH